MKVMNGLNFNQNFTLNCKIKLITYFAIKKTFHKKCNLNKTPFCKK